jgi:DNA-binding transcriptional MerR regulator
LVTAPPQEARRSALEELFPIRTMARMTGVNPGTLRAWERRYGLIEPTRTPSGHRLYSRAQVDRVRRVTALIEQGISIRQAAALVTREDADGVAPGVPDDAWETFRHRALGAIRAYDEAALDAVFGEVLALFPVDTVTRHLVLPLLTELGDSWATRDAGIAEEHFFTAHIRGRLAARRRGQGAEGSGPVIVAACIPGEHHDIGLLMFCLACQGRGFRLVLLGPDMPTEDLPDVVARAGAAALVLSGTVDPGARFLTRDLATLIVSLKVPVFVGGPVSTLAADRVAEAGAVPLGEEIAAAVERLSRLVKP